MSSAVKGGTQPEATRGTAADPGHVKAHRRAFPRLCDEGLGAQSCGLLLHGILAH